MPISASADSARWGNSRLSAEASPAPIASEGEKTPPGMPLIADKIVATNFNGAEE